MTAIYYDTEFIENGSTIDLISIGMVREDGAEYYAVSSEFSLKALAGSEWLMANVWPSLPQVRGDARMMILSSMREGASNYRHVKNLFARGSLEVKPREQIADEVAHFVQTVPDPQLWAWYAAYDHVALCQLFGRMVNLPAGMPMFTNDLKQECVRLGDPRVPQQTEGHHNALADARHNKVIADYLRKHVSEPPPEPVGPATLP